MPHCEKCQSSLDNSDVLYTKLGAVVCKNCFNYEELRGQGSRSSDEQNRQLALGVLFAVFGIAVAVIRFVLVASG